MLKTHYNLIGVMSGTSLDGIDLAHVAFKKQTAWSFTILEAETIPYPKEWKERLSKLTKYTKEKLVETDRDYTEYLATIINTFINEHGIKKLDGVCSHGHTALHRPENGLTYQIGNLPILSKLINQIVVCDFRVQDVAMGGQGAPLVPIGDRLLFSEYDYCLNLGGFANISLEKEGDRTAYDICPVNIVLNHYANLLGLPYDESGAIASKNQVNEELLKSLNALGFYNLSPPKSLGYEWVQEMIFPLIDEFNLSAEEVLATFTMHIAVQISNQLKKNNQAKMLVTGGGAYNAFLIGLIQELTEVEVVVPSSKIVEFKEALIFAFLGLLRLRNEINCLSSVTGANKNHSSGKIYML